MQFLVSGLQLLFSFNQVCAIVSLFDESEMGRLQGNQSDRFSVDSFNPFLPVGTFCLLYSSASMWPIFMCIVLRCTSTTIPFEGLCSYALYSLGSRAAFILTKNI